MRWTVTPAEKRVSSPSVAAGHRSRNLLSEILADLVDVLTHVRLLCLVIAVDISMTVKIGYCDTIGEGQKCQNKQFVKQYPNILL